MVKLEGVGEGMFAELAEDMAMCSGWLSWSWSALHFFCTPLHPLGTAGDIS